MSSYKEQIPAHGLRRISADLPRGSISVERVEGEHVLLEASRQLQLRVHDDRLIIGFGHGKASGKPRVEIHFGHDLHDLHDLETQITDVVSDAMESLFGALPGGMAGADLRIGVPAILERPEITLGTGAGELSIVGVTADWQLKSGLGEISVTRCGGVLAVYTGRGDLSVNAFTGAVRGQSGAGDLLAQQVAGPLALRTGHGSIAVEQCLAGGSLHSGAGDLRCEWIGGAWELHSGSGDVAVMAADGLSLAVVTGSGDVQLGGGPMAALRVTTSSGDVHCDSVLAGPRHEIHTGHGDIELALAEKPGARLQIITGHGDVSSDFPLVKVGKQGPPSMGSKRYVGNVGDSAIDVELRTSAGDITISRRSGERSTTATAEEQADRAQATAAASSAAEFTHATGEQRPAEAAARAQALHLDPDLSVPQPPLVPLTPGSPPGAAPEAPGTRTTSPAVETTAAPPSEPVTSPRLSVLQSLQRGEINVEEAGQLLEALDRV